jgi:PKD repeat protein
VLFRVEAEGLDGNDNNLFAIAVNPSHAQLFSYRPAIRLATHPGDQMRFFPEVPLGTTQIAEENFDLDPDGGRIELVPPARGGRSARAIPIRPSGSGSKTSTNVIVPYGADGARWTYRITKATQRKGNTSFHLQDQYGQPLRTYFTRADWVVAARGIESGPTPSCNTFEFDASASYDSDNEALTYRWDFGDGTTGEGIRARHTYATPGEYRVVLAVKDSSGTDCCESQAEQVLQVNVPPTAVLQAPASACVGSGIRLSATQSTGSQGASLSYRWDFGDGTTAEGMAVMHTYARGGTYHVKLLVDDNQGTSCSVSLATSSIRVNAPPIAMANDGITMCVDDPEQPLQATFSAAGSNDPDYDALSYRWDFGDGTMAEGSRVSHIYQRTGRYTAILAVDDGSGTTCSIATASVPVHLNRAPIAVAGPDIAGCPGEAMMFNAIGSSDPDGDLLTYQWDFGDDQIGKGSMVDHRYATSGNYQVTVTVDDGSGLTCGTSVAEFIADINTPPAAKMAIQGERGTRIISERIP